MVLVFDYMKLDMSLFDEGRMLIKGVHNKEMLLEVARDMFKTITLTVKKTLRDGILI